MPAVRLLRGPFTVADYHRLAETGILDQDDRVELLDGQIVEMTPIGGPHASCVIRLADMLSVRVLKTAIVSQQGPLVLADRSQPQPDILVLKRRADLSGAWLPRHEDAWLVIEVADTSLERDRDVKIPLYAEAGIPEVWLVDLPGDQIQVYRDPGPDGYRDVRTVTRGGTLSAVKLPGLEIAAADVLG